MAATQVPKPKPQTRNTQTQTPQGFDGSDATSSTSLDKVPLDTGLETQIFVTVSVGTPRQRFKVILDTGSSVFGIFCDSPPKKGERKFSAHIYLPHFIPFGGPQKKGGKGTHPRRKPVGRGRAGEGNTHS